MRRAARNPIQMLVLCFFGFATVTAPAIAAVAPGEKTQLDAHKPLPQPVPFSHKLHCEKNIPCVLCHQTATTGETADLPAAEVCMVCHQSVAARSPAIRKLANYARQHKPIPWVRVYSIRDFVFFSHKRHSSARVGCAACHGQVCESDVLKQEIKLSMMFCVGCHKTQKATVKCDACHTLSM